MKTRKLLAVVLAVAMLASFISVPVFAEGEGAILEDLGILEGPDEDGVTEAYLATTATRAQAALVHLRLFGLEADALAFDDEDTFMDAATATEYWQPILEYLKANPDLGWQGDDEGYFMPTAAINGQQFTKVLLVALGYVEGTDFTYEETMTFAAGIGLDALADKAAMDLTVEDLAVALVQALGLTTTGAEDWTLVSQLVAEGLVDEAAAEAAGFEVTPAAFVVVSAEATATDEVTVTMSTDIPEGTTLILKKGTIGIVTTSTTDGATATLTGLYDFLPGTYTVTVGEAVSAPFEVEAQMAVELTLGAETIFDEGTQDLEVMLSDQYGEAMSLTGTNSSVFNQMNGFVYTLSYGTAGTTITIDADEEEATVDMTVEDDEIYVFVYDPDSQLQVSGVVAVEAAPYLAGITIEGYAWNVDDEDAARFYVGDTTAVLDVECVDQYGEEYVLTAADLTEGMSDPDKVQVLVSNDMVLGVSTTPNSDGDLEITGDMAGSAIVTLVLPTMSIIEQSEMIEVYATAILDSLVIVGATETAYVGEDADFSAVGYDQYEEEYDFTTGDMIDFTSNNSLVLESSSISVTADNEITYTPDGEGTATVFVFLNGELQGQADITANPEAVPFAITAVDAPGAMELGTYHFMSAAHLTVIDQYGREMDYPWAPDFYYEISEVTDAGYVELEMDGPYTYVLSTAGLSTGTDTFVAYLTDDGEILEESGFQFDVMNVYPDDIATYTLEIVEDTLYSDPEGWELYFQHSLYSLKFFMDESGYWDFPTDPANLTEEFNPYASEMIIKGYLEDGTEVLLSTGRYLMPYDVDLVTFSMDEVGFTPTPWSQRYSEPWTASEYPTIVASGGGAGTCTVKVWVDGIAVASDTVEVKNDTPYVASITGEFDEIDAKEESLMPYFTASDITGYFIAVEVYDLDDILGEDLWDDIIDWYISSSQYGEDMDEEELFISFFLSMLFEVEDQYGVELARFPTAMAGLTRYSMNMVEEDDESLTLYYTLLTPEGTVWDTIKITNAEYFLMELFSGS